VIPWLLVSQQRVTRRHTAAVNLRDLSIRAFRRRDGRVIPLEEQERDYILWVLEEAHGNQTLAAQMLGIDRVSLWRKLKRYEGEKTAN